MYLVADGRIVVKDKSVRFSSLEGYQRLLMDHSNTSSIPYCILWDMYTPYGIERADNSSIGVGNIELRTNFTVEQTWQS